MFGAVFRTALRRSETSAVRAFADVNDCFKLFDANKAVPTQELYDAFKFLASDNTFGRKAIQDERYSEALNQLETRISSLNSSYLGNFALRLMFLNQNNNYLDTKNEANVEQTKKLLEKMANAMIEKGGHVREITQVAYAAANVGIVNHPIFDFEKQQLSLNIDLATPDSINLSIQTAYRRGSRDRVFFALLCEKLSELTDRFTANDVVMTLRSLARTGWVSLIAQAHEGVSAATTVHADDGQPGSVQRGTVDTLHIQACGHEVPDTQQLQDRVQHRQAQVGPVSELHEG